MRQEGRLTRRRWSVAIALVVSLALGAAVAAGVGSALGLRYADSDVPIEHAEAAPEQAVAPAPEIDTIATPADRRLELAATAVADALVARGRPRPAATRQPGAAGRTLRAVTTDHLAGATSAEAFQVTTEPNGSMTVTGASVVGAAAGLYTIADRIRSGTDPATGAPQLPLIMDGSAPGDAPDADPSMINGGDIVEPRLGLRLTDVGSVGREADVAAFRAGDDYSLNTDIVGGALLPDAPWVDPAAVARISDEFQDFVDHSLRQGYNGVVIPGFLEYVTFDKVGVYDAGDDHVARAEALVAAFAPVFRYAADLGMRVYLLTDMLALSPPLERYLEETVGGLDVTDHRLWKVYQAALDELFDRLPFASGLMIRIGEGGDVYKQAGWDYSSRLAVTTDDAVGAMLRAFLDTAAKRDKDIIFRTWTVGVGAVGDLHTNPASYDQVLGGIDDPHLIVSTKYTQGDFYSHLPFNPTLDTGDHRRIVEFQARREFEVFGALPNDLTALHQQALRRFLADNPHVEGVWNWTQDGGPLRAGPMSLYLKSGFWQLYDLNTYATARLAWDPDTPAPVITADWIRQTFTSDPATARAIGEMFALSREAITTGLYIGPYADKSVKALGLEPPPMMWIFEWDIVTGDSAALDSIYAVSRDRIDEAIAGGASAEALARRMRDLVAATDTAKWHDPALRQRLTDTLDYQVDLFHTLGAYRTMVLRHAQWLDTGSDTARAQWRDATREYKTAKDHHLTRYGGDTDLPAYNFTPADIGAGHADRDATMAWLARILLAVTLALLIAGTVTRHPVARALWLGATRPWRLRDHGTPVTRTQTIMVIALPAAVLVASRSIYTWFAGPAHLALVLAAWLLFALAARTATKNPFALYATIGGVALLRSVILLAVLAVRGPGHYWLRFWTAPTARAVYVTIAFAAFCWLFVATATVLGGRRGAGATIGAVGVTVAVVGGAVAAIGLEPALTIWNDQLALLPWGLSRILGITVYLGIPTSLPLAAAIAGVILAAAGSAIATTRGRIAA